MESFTYPLLCWQLEPDAVFGMLLGTHLQAVDRHPKRLKSTLAETVEREWERERHVSEPDIADARLKIVTVQAHLAHRTDKGSFPLPAPTRFEVAAVHGRNETDGYSMCYLPYLEQSFYYYDDAQLPVLIEHYARERLDGLDPETAKCYLMPGTPWLEQVEARRHRESPGRGMTRYLREAREQLGTLADPLPSNGARRGLHVFPEAAWEQSALVEDIASRLLLGRNVLLVGETGVGKSVAILEAIRRAHQRSRTQDPQPSFWRSHAERLIGQAKYLGEWQSWCDQLIEWIDADRGVLWVTDLLQMIQAGGEHPEESMAAYLLPALRRGTLRLVGEAHPSELEAARRLLPGFIDCFEPLVMPEMEAPRARRVLDLFAAHARNTQGVDIEPAALETGYRLLHRYIRYERFPGKAVKFFGECVRNALSTRQTLITESEAIGQFARTTGVPERFLRDDRPLDEAEVDRHFASRLFGQEAALAHLKDIVYTFKAGLQDPAKPIATLLFAGPTGVGKTAAAKALAAFFFGAAGGDPLMRIDMSEFQHPFQVARLIGDGAQPGKLVQHVRQRPFTVLLLDEIEKADASVFDLLLAVLDEGRLRDSRGRLTDFRNTLIVMTTNLGVRQGSSVGFTEPGGDHALHDIQRFFRPEFFNRIDRVVPFASLTREAIGAITQAELAAVGRRDGLDRRGIRLDWTPAVRDFIADAGFSPRYGARPLQRAIERHVVGAIARALFDGMPDGTRLSLALAGAPPAVTVRCLPPSSA